jgi:hypothetical protein
MGTHVHAAAAASAAMVVVAIKTVATAKTVVPLAIPPTPPVAVGQGLQHEQRRGSNGRAMGTVAGEQQEQQ